MHYLPYSALKHRARPDINYPYLERTYTKSQPAKYFYDVPFRRSIYWCILYILPQAQLAYLNPCTVICCSGSRCPGTSVSTPMYRGSCDPSDNLRWTTSMWAYLYLYTHTTVPPADGRVVKPLSSDGRQLYFSLGTRLATLGAGVCTAL